jgi:hypothetical protein
LFECIEVFYNQRRRHSSAGRMTQAARVAPEAHERLA